jgi:hypothetical protein
LQLRLGFLLNSRWCLLLFFNVRELFRRFFLGFFLLIILGGILGWRSLNWLGGWSSLLGLWLRLFWCFFLLRSFLQEFFLLFLSFESSFLGFSELLGLGGLGGNDLLLLLKFFILLKQCLVIKLLLLLLLLFGCITLPWEWHVIIVIRVGTLAVGVQRVDSLSLLLLALWCLDSAFDLFEWQIILAGGGRKVDIFLNLLLLGLFLLLWLLFRGIDLLDCDLFLLFLRLFLNLHWLGFLRLFFLWLVDFLCLINPGLTLGHFLVPILRAFKWNVSLLTFDKKPSCSSRTVPGKRSI